MNIGKILLKNWNVTSIDLVWGAVLSLLKSYLKGKIRLGEGYKGSMTC